MLPVHFARRFIKSQHQQIIPFRQQQLPLLRRNALHGLAGRQRKQLPRPCGHVAAGIFLNDDFQILRRGFGGFRRVLRCFFRRRALQAYHKRQRHRPFHYIHRLLLPISDYQ